MQMWEKSHLICGKLKKLASIRMKEKTYRFFSILQNILKELNQRLDRLRVKVLHDADAGHPLAV